MKILFVSDVSIENVIGGAERVLYEQTTRLAARGHDVHILTRRLPSHHAGEAVLKDVREWRYHLNAANPVFFFLSSLKNGRRLFETLSGANHFDCINFHQPVSALPVLMSKKSRDIRKIYTCHSLAFEEFISRNALPRSFFQKILYRFHVISRKWLEKKALDASDAIIVLSGYTREKLRDIYGTPDEKITVIAGGIDLGRFHPAADKAAVRRRLGLPEDKTILLTVRNLVPRMGLENLIHAMREVVPSVPDIHLVIGGSGPLKESLVGLVHKLDLDQYIDFEGFIAEDALPAYYRAADLFVLPTVDLEGFGLVTLEALASGVPVLGTPVGGTREILTRLDPGLLFKDVSAEAISALIIKACKKYRDSPDAWRQDSARCRAFAEENYSWDANIVSTERLFRAVIS